MSEALEQLQKIGAQKIHEDTHIPIKHVQAILHGSFEGFTKVQFIGFISIIEKEYSLELLMLRKGGEEFFIDKNISNVNDSLFVSQKSKQKQKSSLLYSILALIIFLIALLFYFTATQQRVYEERKLDNRVIKSVRESIIKENNISHIVKPELNVTKEKVSLQEGLKNPKKIKSKESIKKSFEIVAKNKVWFGYIDVKTNKHYQKKLRGSIALNPTKEWLLMFGHGHIDMFINAEHIKFKTYNNLRFLYKDGKLKAVTKKEFRVLNKGRRW